MWFKLLGEYFRTCNNNDAILPLDKGHIKGGKYIGQSTPSRKQSVSEHNLAI
jgi:hypothetical protein